MANLFKHLLGIDVTSRRFSSRSAPARHELLRKESEIGGRLFGPVPKGHYRQFFNLDRYTWVWYEDWEDGDGEVNSTTYTYEVHENGILKIEEGKPGYYIEGDELIALIAAIRRYYEEVSREIYHRDPATGKLLTV